MKTQDFLRNRGRSKLSQDDLWALENAVSKIEHIAAQTTVVRARQAVQHSTFLVEGFMCRYLDDRKGERQFVGLHVPGEFVDLHAFPLIRLDHALATLSPCTIATVPHDKLAKIVATRPELARMLWFSTLLDAAMHREWIFTLGRLDAAGKVCHLFCEFQARLEAVGRANGDQFALPINQIDIANASGLTNVHVNRVLRDLRESKILTFSKGVVTIMDRAKLIRAAQFDPYYLYIEAQAPQDARAPAIIDAA